MKYYFTFGTDPVFPFHGGHLIVEANSKADAIRIFRHKYPDIIRGVLNYSFDYTEEEWAKVSTKMREKEPYEVLSASDYRWLGYEGVPHTGYDDVYIFVPEETGHGQIIQIQEGDGSNLDDEDHDHGYVDYINYYIYRIDGTGRLTESDGGQILWKELVQDRYGCLADSIGDVLDFIFDENRTAVILSEFSKGENYDVQKFFQENNEGIEPNPVYMAYLPHNNKLLVMRVMLTAANETDQMRLDILSSLSYPEGEVQVFSYDLDYGLEPHDYDFRPIPIIKREGGDLAMGDILQETMRVIAYDKDYTILV